MSIVKILNNKFLNRMYPSGDLGEVLIENIYLSFDSVEFSIHTRNKPLFIPPKRGEWTDNRVVVIKFLAQAKTYKMPNIVSCT